MCIRDRQNIKYNKRCLHYNITPKYISSNINSRHCSEKIKSVWIKEEIKRLYILKSGLNTKLYLAHLEILNEFHPAVINDILDIVNRQINKVVNSLKRKQLRKFQNLYTKQHNDDNNTVEHSHVFHQRVANYTGIKFEHNEMTLRCV